MDNKLEKPEIIKLKNTVTCMYQILKFAEDKGFVDQQLDMMNQEIKFDYKMVLDKLGKIEHTISGKEYEQIDSLCDEYAFLTDVFERFPTTPQKRIGKAGIDQIKKVSKDLSDKISFLTDQLMEYKYEFDEFETNLNVNQITNQDCRKYETIIADYSKVKGELESTNGVIKLKDYFALAQIQAEMEAINQDCVKKFESAKNVTIKFRNVDDNAASDLNDILSSTLTDDFADFLKNKKEAFNEYLSTKSELEVQEITEALLEKFEQKVKEEKSSSLNKSSEDLLNALKKSITEKREALEEKLKQENAEISKDSELNSSLKNAFAELAKNQPKKTADDYIEEFKDFEETSNTEFESVLDNGKIKIVSKNKLPIC